MSTAKPTKLDSAQIKKDFPVFERIINDHPLIYLDNAATSQRPQSVIDAIVHYYTQCNANVHRGVHTMSYEASVLYEDAHKKVAAFINAPHWREVVFTHNITEAINMMAFSWAATHLEKGDEIVITAMEHHSNLVPWMMLRDRMGVVLKFVDVDEVGRLKMEQFDELLSERTKLVTVAYASNVTGVINPVADIVKKAHAVGAKCFVDAAQALPHFAVDVQALGVDFLAATGHKMLGPTGIGFFWASKEVLENMPPFMGGGDMILKVTLEEATWNDLPWKFEAGTPNIAGGIGLGAAVDYLQNLGMDNVRAHEKDLMDEALNVLQAIDGLNLYGPLTSEDRLTILPFNIEGVHPHDVADILDRRGIAVRSGDHCAQPYMTQMGIDFTARASFYVYNSSEDIAALAEALKQVKTIFKL
jgi:cysteine desulfurase/selenocysteine lyase